MFLGALWTSNIAFPYQISSFGLMAVKRNIIRVEGD